MQPQVKEIIKIRKANTDDINQIRQLFYDTITTINKKDYDEKQILAWILGAQNTEAWWKKIHEQHFFVAERDNVIVGFCSITEIGYIDYLYVHKDFQGQGIATALLKAAEQVADEFKLSEIWAEVSITARPFFKSKGFEITKIYTKKVGEVEFEDCIMTKKKL